MSPLRASAYVFVVMAFELVLLQPAGTSGEEGLFEQAVAPILSARCVSCHNEKTRQGGLSLATAQSALASGVIVAHRPEDSILLQYISGQEPEMPKAERPLSQDEVAVIRQWIAQGASWPQSRVLSPQDIWWSRQPLSRPEVPAVPAGWQHRVRTPIDAFIIARLHQAGLTLSPDTDKRTLIRRLYYDLVGLPPTPEEVVAFVGSEDPHAYEKLVDRLLGSPHYGERWARHWLDVVKYADTCGYDKDKLRRNAWPYRDYVIRSFNEDKPYWRFVQEQIAGDAIFPGDPDGILGLGFLAAGPWDFIGHVEVPEAKIDGKIARHLDRDEMVTNTLSTFCSVTIGCARCHDHKFDPFTQEHYYGLQAIFAAVDRAERRYDTDPSAEKQRRQLEARRTRLQQQLAALEADLKKAGGKELSALKGRIDQLSSQAQPQDKRPEYGYHSQIERTASKKKWVQIDLGRPVTLQSLVLHPCHDEYADIGSGFGFPVRFRIELANSENFDDSVVVADQTGSDFPNPYLTPYRVNQKMRARFVRIIATKLAERRKDYIFALAEVEAFDRQDNNVAARKQVTASDSIEAPVRWRRANLVDGIWPQSADPQACKALATAQAQLASLQDKIDPPKRRVLRATLQEQLQQTRDQLKQLSTGRVVYAAATQFAPQGQFKPTGGVPREIHVLHRGDVQKPLQRARPGTFPLPGDSEFVFHLPKDHSEADRRAALAYWVVQKRNPLTWRSIVNRVWLYHFDQAIVASPNDLGRMGQRPTHPLLLDWLAVEFRDRGQSLKKLHKLIVTSSVYRQSSAHNEASATIDAGNQLLWRMNRRRLEAEEIRDSVLALSGRLDRTMGGPGYYLFKLERATHSPHYEYHKFDPNDASSHRRSIYRFIVRSQPNPYMTTLDCADSSQSTPKRDETLTALQALCMLNSRFHLVMANHFAARLKAEERTLSAQVRRAMVLTTGRQATEGEQQRLEAYAQKHGLANLCRVMFNLSEFVYLD